MPQQHYLLYSANQYFNIINLNNEHDKYKRDERLMTITGLSKKDIKQLTNDQYGIGMNKTILTSKMGIVILMSIFMYNCYTCLSKALHDMQFIIRDGDGVTRFSAPFCWLKTLPRCFMNRLKRFCKIFCFLDRYWQIR